MIYLDNAATSFPKPVSVICAAARCMREYCGNPGRGSHRLALAAAECLYESRVAAAELFDASSPDKVCFMPNATYALNTAIKGLIKPGSHIITSDIEHNSVIRPLEQIAREYGCSISVFETRGDDDEILSRVKRLIRPDTAAVVCLHVSNIINRVLPINRLGQVCSEAGIMFILDASQSAGSYKISIRDDGITALCMPGHKGLYGVQGSGFLIAGEGVSFKTLVEGGSGINSVSAFMPDFLPDRLEAGTMNTPAAAALTEGIRYVRARGEENIRRHEMSLYSRTVKKLSQNENIVIYEKKREGAIILFNIRGNDAARVGAMLDERGVCVRTGLHCSPAAHRAVKTPPGGAVRASFGAFNTEREADIFCDAVFDIVKSI